MDREFGKNVAALTSKAFAALYLNSRGAWSHRSAHRRTGAVTVVVDSGDPAVERKAETRKGAGGGKELAAALAATTWKMITPESFAGRPRPEPGKAHALRRGTERVGQGRHHVQ